MESTKILKRNTTKACTYIKAETYIKIYSKSAKRGTKTKDSFSNQRNNYNGYDVHSGNYNVDFEQIK